MESYWFVWMLVPAALAVFVHAAVPEIKLTKEVTGNCTEIQADDGDFMTVHYEGTFKNGTVFDSSFEKNVTFAFELGDAGLIKGWNMGLQDACVGDELKLVIPYVLGYGEAGLPPTIPPRTDLVFLVHVLGIEEVGYQRPAGTGNTTASSGTNGTTPAGTNGTGPGSPGGPRSPDDHEPYDPSGLLYKLQFLAIPVAVILLLVVVYCIYTVEYPDRKIKFYRVSDHDSSNALNGVI